LLPKSIFPPIDDHRSQNIKCVIIYKKRGVKK